MERLQKYIYQVKGKLQAEGINYNDYNKAIQCLARTVAPNICIAVYKDYIYQK